MRLPNKLLGILLVVSLIGLAFKSIVRADSPQSIYYPTFEEMVNAREQTWKDANDAGQNIPNLGDNMQAANNWNMFAVASSIAPTCYDPQICDPNKTALGAVAFALRTIYSNPPASGLAYVSDVLHNARLIPPAYAQGIGFAGMRPLLPLWKTMRDISYGILIIIMIAIGFMIIFRMKIDPKTVISVQAALPKVILTLILITFSYPIVGFMIDLMYVTMAILIAAIGSGMGLGPTQIADTQTYFLTSGWVHLFGTVFSGGLSSLEDFLLGNFGPWALGSGIGAIVGSIVTGSLPAILLGFFSISIVFILILLLGLLFTFIRILLLLLNSYIQLLIAVVLGPIQLLVEAVPGRSAFSTWLLNVIANLSVFPTTVAILMFGQYLTQMGNTGETILHPPLLGIPGNERAFPAFLGLGVLFLAPNLIAQVKKIFHPKPILPVSAGTLMAPLTGATQTTMGAASQFYYLQQMPLINKLFKGGGGPHQPGQ